jgi:chemotaxis protein histidine kinase CheA
LAAKVVKSNETIVSNYNTAAKAGSTATAQAKKADSAAAAATTYASKASAAAKKATTAAKTAKSSTSTKLAKTATAQAKTSTKNATSANQADSSAAKYAKTAATTVAKAKTVANNASAAVDYVQSIAAQSVASSAATASDSDKDKQTLADNAKTYATLRAAGATDAQIKMLDTKYNDKVLTGDKYGHPFDAWMIDGTNGTKTLVVRLLSGTHTYILPDGTLEDDASAMTTGVSKVNGLFYYNGKIMIREAANRLGADVFPAFALNQFRGEDGQAYVVLGAPGGKLVIIDENLNFLTKDEFVAKGNAADFSKVEKINNSDLSSLQQQFADNWMDAFYHVGYPENPAMARAYGLAGKTWTGQGYWDVDGVFHEDATTK